MALFKIHRHDITLVLFGCDHFMHMLYLNGEGYPGHYVKGADHNALAT